MTAPDQVRFVEGMREAIKDVLTEQEEATRLDKVEDMLNVADAAVNELNDLIAKRDGELATASADNEGLKAQIKELKAKADELEAKLAEADQKSEEFDNRATAAEEKLASIETDRKLEIREAELIEAKVAKSEDKRTTQLERVREMSDEEFAAYKEELVDVRSEVEAELRAAAAATAAGTSGAADGGVEVAPADLDAALREEAAAAAAATLDVEVVPESMKSVYKEMAEYMADSLTAGRE